MENIAKRLHFDGSDYTYSHAKDNILIYTTQPVYHYSDWVEDGGILVVRYRMSKNIKDRYVVLHQIRITYDSGRIIHEDISKLNKIPTIIE